MSNPHIHAQSSAKRYGGIMEDYLDIHILMDRSKQAVPDVRHRILTHTPFFAEDIIPLVFGDTRKNSSGITYSPKQIAYDHIKEDYHGQIPSNGDWFKSVSLAKWMLNGKESCPSRKEMIIEFENKSKVDLEYSN